MSKKLVLKSYIGKYVQDLPHMDFLHSNSDYEVWYDNRNIDDINYMVDVHGMIFGKCPEYS